jgi:hypothetical protein
VERVKQPDNELRPFEKGIDFYLHFRGRRFSLDDIRGRYCCSYRQALRLKSQAARIVNLVPVGFHGETGCRDRWYWQIKECEPNKEVAR